MDTFAKYNRDLFRSVLAVGIKLFLCLFVLYLVIVKLHSQEISCNLLCDSWELSFNIKLRIHLYTGSPP